VGKKYGSKGYPHTGNAAHMGSMDVAFITKPIVRCKKIKTSTPRKLREYNKKKIEKVNLEIL
jgi:hypothetical protein